MQLCFVEDAKYIGNVEIRLDTSSLRIFTFYVLYDWTLTIGVAEIHIQKLFISHILKNLFNKQFVNDCAVCHVGLG